MGKKVLIVGAGKVQYFALTEVQERFREKGIACEIVSEIHEVIDENAVIASATDNMKQVIYELKAQPPLLDPFISIKEKEYSIRDWGASRKGKHKKYRR
ncbi:hypothetical protein EZS27_035201 [termite gut metagenome]|uniref:Uncharacterized protein n=1 Tax=termite gut metagenome TaxID=433724 RepID=A0A5J4PWV4_9ZZZZ